MPRFVIALVLILALAACASASSGGKSNGSQAHLRITVWPHGKSGVSVKYTLVCPARAGAIKSRRSACAKLSRLGSSAFAPVPKGTACTEIYGGPQLALVTGTLGGKKIDARFNRSNGCEIQRWQTLGFLLDAAP